MVGRAFKSGCVERLAQTAFVTVVGPEPALGVDHLTLVVDDVGEKGEVLDAVGFEVEDQLERRIRCPILVYGVVPRGLGVVVAAGVVDHDDFAMVAQIDTQTS